MLFRPSRQSRIAGGKKDQMIQIGAGQTQRAFLSDQRDPGFGTEIFAAFAASGIARRDENFDFFNGIRLRGHKSFRVPEGVRGDCSLAYSDNVTVPLAQ